jgi:hypothetical protein
MLRLRPALLSVGVAVVLAFPAQAAALTPAEWSPQANATCAGPFAKDRKIFKKASVAFHRARTRGAFRRSARLFLKSQRTELVGVANVEDLPGTDDPTFNELIARWVSLQRASAQYRIAFAKAILGSKPFGKLVHFDKLAAQNAVKASQAGGRIGLTKC